MNCVIRPVCDIFHKLKPVYGHDHCCVPRLCVPMSVWDICYVPYCYVLNSPVSLLKNRPQHFGVCYIALSNVIVKMFSKIVLKNRRMFSNLM